MPASNSPIPYTGNKSCIIDTILAVMPEHNVYIEPCMGSAEVFLRKKPAKTEIINDYNGDLVNFFRVLQSNEKLAFLLGRLYLSANSELIFHQNKDLLKGTPNILDDVAGTAKKVYGLSWNDVQLAAAFLENQVYSFRSTGDAFAIAKRVIRDRFNRLIAANERLGEATILHRDYKDAIIYGAKPGAFIMLDPPYKGTEDYYRKSNFDENQHAELFRFMAEEVDQKFGGECKFLITYNNDPYIRYLADMYGLDTFFDASTKNASDLAAYAIHAWESGWGYVWGTYGEVLTESLLNYKCGQYPEGVAAYENYIRSQWLGGRTTDCVGLIKGYGWLDPETMTIRYGSNGMPDINADQMYHNAKVSGPISTIPEIPGLAVWHKGHIGVYIGNGEVIEAMGTHYGVVRTKVSERNWTHWLKVPYINYD